MRVTRAQAAENKLRVVDVASRLFRKYGFDGIGLKELMNGAGLTQGGFYKQFGSKEDLAAQACERAMGSAAEQWSRVAAAKPENPFSALIDFYLSPEHRDEFSEGCPLVALGSDAGRQGVDVKSSFENGIRAHLEVLDSYMPPGDVEGARARSMSVLATMVGALLLSRATDDEVLSNDFLKSAANQLRNITPD
jgi:TetR/AcrR family transcriptional repressor of nem operon